MKTLENCYQLRIGMLLPALLLVFGLAHMARADDWSLKDRNGTQYTLSGLHGKWVLVNFWAPWCPPCLKEIPDLVAVQKQYQDLQVIGVAVMYKTRKKVMDVVNRESISYPIVFGNEDTAGDFGGLDGLPTSFLYTPSGKLVGQHQGILSRSDLEQAMAQKPGAAALFTR